MKEEKQVEQNMILEDVPSFIRDFHQENIPSSYRFHDFPFVKSVAEKAEAIAKEEKLGAEDKEILLLANWFRYTGMSQSYNDYLPESVRILEEYLGSKDYDPKAINRVKALILSAHAAHRPKGILEEITQDAGNAYLGKKSFLKNSTYLRVEMEAVKGKKISDKVWEQLLYDLLAEGNFYTTYGTSKYPDRIAKYLDSQRKSIYKADRDETRKRTGKEFGRGIDTLYRATYRNHISLSSIADGKANMMISINTIILSAIVTLLGTSITLTGQVSFQHFRYFAPILILLISVLGSAVFAILSANPKVTSKNIDKKDVVKRTKSMLFFGNFINVSQQEFVDTLELLKKNQKLLYDNMAVDIYELGHVLSTKYKMIKISYNIFMYGLIACVAAFLFVILYSQFINSGL